MCMYVCVCMYVYVCICMCMYVYVCVCMYIFDLFDISISTTIIFYVHKLLLLVKHRNYL